MNALNEIPQVKTCEELTNYPDEYREAIIKIVRSHAVNEPVSYTHLTLPTTPYV